ncbi:hypothetical protein EFA69_02330 [Rufibacter immobilis]|uniref:Uncharacterized protein n=1 Tax=Rufibacter immobilis TaxID=1348778 RepID=A0A3M9N8F1_9BACT|nr:hypothetical protein EFA69_02330 [Rufibacter immobilis]
MEVGDGSSAGVNPSLPFPRGDFWFFAHEAALEESGAGIGVAAAENLRHELTSQAISFLVQMTPLPGGAGVGSSV